MVRPVRPVRPEDFSIPCHIASQSIHVSGGRIQNVHAELQGALATFSEDSEAEVGCRSLYPKRQRLAVR